jgi:SPP1 gp7 family putative phage head morphogenesis protein
MQVCRDNLATAIKMLGKEEVKRVYLSAQQVDRLEAKWRSNLKKLLDQYNQKVASALMNTGHMPLEIDFTEFYFDHAIEVMGEAVRTTHANREISKTKHLSSPPPLKIPRSFSDLQKLYDKWRKTGKAPKRIESLANKVKKAYYEKCQSVWSKHTEGFRAGETFNMKDAVSVIQKAGDKTYSRAKMIVETETTNYYNQTRREIYDQSPEVTHYLFLAIRDQATTKWCKTRHGLVYEKGKEVTDRETPAIHWNCRSEMVPLTKQNPKHAVLINDGSKRRENRSPEPLPKGWTQVDQATHRHR